MSRPTKVIPIIRTRTHKMSIPLDIWFNIVLDLIVEHLCDALTGRIVFQNPLPSLLLCCRTINSCTAQAVRTILAPCPGEDSVILCVLAVHQLLHTFETDLQFTQKSPGPGWLQHIGETTRRRVTRTQPACQAKTSQSCHSRSPTSSEFYAIHSCLGIDD